MINIYCWYISGFDIGFFMPELLVVVAGFFKVRHQCATGKLRHKKRTRINPKSLNLLVPRAGVEPARPYERGILSPLRLPISPPRHR